MAFDSPNFVPSNNKDLGPSDFTSTTFSGAKEASKAPLKGGPERAEDHDIVRNHKEPNFDVVRLETGAAVHRQKRERQKCSRTETHSDSNTGLHVKK